MCLSTLPVSLTIYQACNGNLWRKTNRFQYLITMTWMSLMKKEQKYRGHRISNDLMFDIWQLTFDFYPLAMVSDKSLCGNMCSIRIGLCCARRLSRWMKEKVQIRISIWSDLEIRMAYRSLFSLRSDEMKREGDLKK